MCRPISYYYYYYSKLGNRLVNLQTVSINIHFAKKTSYLYMQWLGVIQLRDCIIKVKTPFSNPLKQKLRKIKNLNQLYKSFRTKSVTRSHLKKWTNVCLLNVYNALPRLKTLMKLDTAKYHYFRVYLREQTLSLIHI